MINTESVLSSSAAVNVSFQEQFMIACSQCKSAKL